MNSNFSFLGRASSTVLILIAMFLSAPAARPQVVVKQVVVPGSQADVEGNSLSGGPFALNDHNRGVARMQQVYAASEFFESSAPNGGWIYGVSFRADGGDGIGSYGTDIPSLQIRLSVTARGPDELSPIFAENIGSASALVISGARSIGVTALGDNPEPWTMFFTFSQPYFYNPSSGNLLMDVINVGGGSFVFLDAVNAVGDGVSLVLNKNLGTQIPTGGTVDTVGLVTRFTIVPVPEPSTWALLGLGAVALAWRNRQLFQRRKAHHVTH